MSCEQAHHWMMEKIDGQIDATKASSFDDHLAHCADCRAEWQRLETLDALFSRSPMARPARGFTGRVMVHLDRRRRLTRLALGGVALGVGGLLTAALLLGPSLLTLSALPSRLSVLFDGGRILADYLSRALLAFAESLCATADALMIPLMTTAVLGFLVALAANLAWLRLVQRLRCAPARVGNR
jgi:anti-sigma factor RsiW